ncbi:MAG: tol-pal system protein YbgF [Pseudomonadales bacterium]|nr:tol-pal system protein YbgF [Pseudomonadales bacterium]
MPNWSTDRGGRRTATVLALLLCTGAASAAPAPVYEARPVGEGAPLMAPPGSAPRAAASPAPADDVPYTPPVFDDGSAPPAPAPAVPSRSAADPAAAGVLFEQVQDLRQEVMMLRGLVEAQQNTIERLERESRDRYLDLDRRIARLGGGGGSLPADGAGAPGNDGAEASAPADERAAYERAFALTREKRFDEAVSAFNQFISTWPDGVYVPNAWYWLGEIHLAKAPPDLEQARQAFVQVVQLWPDHPKAPDALYKLGVVYDGLGEREQARSYLQRVLEEHAGTPAARLARRYLDDSAG